MTERLLNAAELGAYLGLSTATVLDRWERGDLPGFRIGGKRSGAVRFRLSEIEAVLEGWRSGPQPAMMVATTNAPAAPKRPGAGTGGTSSHARQA